MSKQIVILGGGSFGTALANLLSGQGQRVQLLVRRPELAATIQSSRQNSQYLPNITLPPNLQVTADPKIIAQADILVLAIPCQFLRANLCQIKHFLPSHCILVNTAKGLEVEAKALPYAIIQAELPNYINQYAVLSGPSFALEVATQKPTALVLAGASGLQEIFTSPWFRTYSSTDIIGVEVGGAVKNIIAIAAGLSDGLSFGLNARAALIARGLAEISRLGLALGAQEPTFMGLSGLGDLVLTCAGDLSRNRQVGLRLSQNETLAQITQSMVMVAEGVATTKAVWELAKNLNIELPITNAVYEVLYNQKNPKQAVLELMTRPLKEER